MLFSGGKHAPSVCPKTGKFLGQGRRHRWLIWMFPVTGFLALIWFVLRVVPKPSRALYPCQRVAFPLASGFVVWLFGLISSVFAFRKAKELLRRSRLFRAAVCFAIGAAGAVVVIVNMPESVVLAEPTPNAPVGVAKGIHPGRVVWVHNPSATDWDGYSSPEHWWQSNHTNLAEVEKMLSAAIRGVAGKNSDAAAWDAIFRYFNDSSGKGDVGYQAGEKIAIKINLTTCNARGEQVDPNSYNKKSSIMNRIDNSPQIILSLLRQLVYTAGVEPNDITVGDPTGLFPNYAYNMLQPEFPDVNYLDNYGGSERTRAEFSDVQLYWSTSAAEGKLADYIPVSFAEASYFINFAVLKGHSAGVTVCAKNHYGSLIRCPDGSLRPELPGLPGDGSYLDYYDIHLSLPSGSHPGMERYRSLVDLMGHPELDGKTVLYLIDGLFGGYYWQGHPYKWDMEPFEGDWPSSIFVSQDPVAIDSVAYDFLAEEWPDVVAYGGGGGSLEGGAEDYLHEAAEANNPASGTFYDPDNDGNSLASLGVHEHWNNPTDKQYSRNLGTGNGIELLALPIPGDFNEDNDVDLYDFAILARAWLSSSGDDNWNPDCDISEPNDNVIDAKDLEILTNNWQKGSSITEPP